MSLTKKEWIEWISYGVVGLFSLSMFVFGAMFPEYTFVNECYEMEETEEPTEIQIERLQELLKTRTTDKEGELKVTCLSYEYLKEIMNGWD